MDRYILLSTGRLIPQFSTDLCVFKGYDQVYNRSHTAPAADQQVSIMVQCMPSPTQVASLDLDRLNQQFLAAEPLEVLTWAVENISDGLVQTTAFSLLVVTHMIYREIQPPVPVPVLFLDTLHHFPETLETAQKGKDFYNLDLKIYRPKGVSTREEFAALYGESLWDTDVDRFHYLTKVEPLQRALRELDVKAWITGRRRDQSVTRRQMDIFELDNYGRLKINPLANWTRKEIWGYTFRNSVLYNPLHDQGYASIGDEPLTSQVQPGEHERAGRWRGTAKTECGIHI